MFYDFNSALTKSFGDNTVLKHIDLTVEKGEVVVIIGPSGSGKTTFLRCLNVLETPNAGNIRIGNKELNFSQKVTKKDIVNLRTQTGMVFQHHNLFPHLTALQNVMEGLVTVKKMGKEEAKKKQTISLKKLVLRIKWIYIHSNYQVDNNSALNCARACDGAGSVTI